MVNTQAKPTLVEEKCWNKIVNNSLSLSLSLFLSGYSSLGVLFEIFFHFTIHLFKIKTQTLGRE